jgi:plasmid stabilization system protein ParE
MVKINWSILAAEDLEEIEEFISSDSPSYAAQTIEKIHSRTFILVSFPKAGRIVPEFDEPTVRELIEGNYRIVYWLKSADEIIILRVHHSARLLE